MKNETIVDRVVERIKQQPLGDLIREEDLYDIIKEAIPKVFFEKQSSRDSYGREIHSKDPVIVELMRDLLKDHAAKAVQQWLEQNNDSLQQYWKDVLDENLVTYVQKLQAEAATRHIEKALSQWIEQVNQQRYSQGLPPMSPITWSR